VAKGLVRNEITYSKEMLEQCVRPMFMKILEWYIGITTDFSVSFGKGGRFMAKHLSRETYEKILSTYADSDLGRNWQAFSSMMDLFGKLASLVGRDRGFKYNIEEETNVRKYIEQLHHRDL